MKTSLSLIRIAAFDILHTIEQLDDEILTSVV